MSYILNIETSTRNCSVSIANSGQTVALREIATEGFSHAEKLHVFVNEVMAEAGISFSDLSAIAVSKGPGSYTGLRIGVSSAKGFCYASNLPLIAVDTLKVLAAAARVTDGVIVPMIDARRMEVYSAVFDSELQAVRQVEAEIIDSASLADFAGPVYIVGDCQQKVESMLSGDKFSYLKEVEFPSAAEMGKLSFEKFKAGDFEDVAYFEPFYLKDFIGIKSKK
ncbi:MAG: tRNA (adenosine(37)-N6)-threonylcarbamoyltransferase complex dimerization subunit type 1 TsaB [Flavobacterium sp.]|nr:tRNA (adenosine(37)-N6)-threonylcarbamoyltransferase complex dimerization subunit type 1 TsaB [Flavobacterium sp.]